MYSVLLTNLTTQCIQVFKSQLTAHTSREMQLQKQEEHLHKREIDLNNWAMDLDQQAKDIQRRYRVCVSE